MLKAWIALVVLVMHVGFLHAQQDSVALKYARTITISDLQERLKVISSDEFEGRETGRPGQKKAARYIRSKFMEFGYGPIDRIDGYYQRFRLHLTYPDTVKLTVGTDTLHFLKDMYYFPGFGDMHLSADDILYLGYGISSPNYDDYGSTPIEGRVVMVSSGEPKDRKGKSLVDDQAEQTEWTSDWRTKVIQAMKRGVKALLIIDDDFSSNVMQYGEYMRQPDIKVGENGGSERPVMPAIYISSKMADAILKRADVKKGHSKLEKDIARTAVTQTLELNVKVELDVRKNKEELTSENVLGYLPGTEKKDELVVVSAHYDHLGKKGNKIYNGADDDGSGTTTVLELAQAFMQAKKEGHGPERSMLFLFVAGEEKGLLGSQFYTDNPVFPLSSTVVDLNIDMIGRIDQKHAMDTNYVYLIGSDKLSSELHELSERINATYSHIELDYKYNKDSDPNRFYYRSDHYNFAKNNIPVIFYFSGVHKDYHRPTDTEDKILYPKMQRIAKLIFYTAWEIANRDERLKVDKGQEPKE